MHSSSEDSSTPLSDGSASGTGTSSSLTYEAFFGLREKAFSLSADPRFLYKSPTHAPAFDALLAGIRRREGLIVLTGEIGTGKTTLCRAVLQQLDRRTFAAFIPDPFVSREDLLKTLLVDFGVIAISDLTRGRFNGASRSELSYLLYEFLDSLVPLQAFAVLVIDETQNLSLPLLEEIRILSDLERREKMLQVVLVGQPELRSNLRLPQMRQVDQRVSVRCELTALDADGVAAYVHHRLVVAGLGGCSVEFTGAAIEALYQASAGVPRVINRLCDRALDRAYVARTRVIKPEFVLDATDDIDSSSDVHEEPRVEQPAPPLPIVPMPVQSPETVAVAPTEPVAIVQHEIEAASALLAEFKVESPWIEPVTVAPRQVEASLAPLEEFKVESPRLEPVAIAPAQADASSPLLEEFRSEAELSIARPPVDSVTRRQWAAVGMASMLIVAASIGVPAWYLRAHATDKAVTGAPQPPTSSDSLSPPSAVAPKPESTGEASSPEAVAAPVSGAPATEDGSYTIAVASFTNSERAQRLVEELTNAGYRARVAEHDWGPPRGRLLQVNVDGYASAAEAERALERIRQLPGGYQDARVVGRQ